MQLQPARSPFERRDTRQQPITPHSASPALGVFVPASWGHHQGIVIAEAAKRAQRRRLDKVQAQRREGHKAEDTMDKALNKMQRSTAQHSAARRSTGTCTSMPWQSMLDHAMTELA